MGLPTTVDYTATEGAPIRPQTFNKIQECIRDGRHGLLRFRVHPTQAVDAGFANTAVIEQFRVRLPAGAGAKGAYWPIALPVGTRIRAVRCYVDDNDGAVELSVRLEKRSRDAASKTLIANEESTGAEVEIAITGLTEVVLEAEVYAIETSASGGGDDITIAYVDIEADKPA
jgi:hypothetical protein